MTHPHPDSTLAGADVVRAQRDGDCVVFFVCLVTAALAMLGLALLTDLEPLPRLLLAAAVTTLAGVTTAAVAS